MSENNDTVQPFNIRRLLYPAIAMLIVGYIYGRPGLERRLGISLPSFGGNQSQVTEADPETRSAKTAQTSSSPNTQSRPSNASHGLSAAQEFKFKELANGHLESPAGLIYQIDEENIHATELVMRHAKDDSTQANHNVFLGSRERIFETLDQAYWMIKLNSPNVSSKDVDSKSNRIEYEVDLERNIGFEGGTKGLETKQAKLSKIRLVLENGNRLILAHPIR